MSEPQPEDPSSTALKIKLEGRVQDLTQLTQVLSEIQSSEIEMLGLQSKITGRELENAELEKNLITSMNRHQTAIGKFGDEVASLQQALSDARDDDDRISYQSRAEKLTEELAEAEEDKAALARDVARLADEKGKVENALAESEDSKVAMSNEIHELGTKNHRLKEELKDTSDSLEDAEDDRVTLSRNLEKLTSEKGRLEDIIRQINSFSSSIWPMATAFASQDANSIDETDTATSSGGMLTPPSSVQTTPR